MQHVDLKILSQMHTDSQVCSRVFRRLSNSENYFLSFYFSYFELPYIQFLLNFFNFNATLKVPLKFVHVKLTILYEETCESL